jgi:hypothetical protein
VPLSEASIDLIFAPAYGSSKKNATDIRLAIDAMELVFTRPEIGTIILLSGDSDFSSLVIKLKEYGKYVIGVGIRESSSDLLVQNCDEYYSYNALAGLVKAGDSDDTRKFDPWELVTEAIGRMQRNGDVMRSDRLKQVMQEIDSSFDEKDLGISKFSKFCLEAAQKGLLHVTKLENGQLDVAPPKGGSAKGDLASGTTALPPARRVVERAPRIETAAGDGDGDAREGRSRRGRRGGRGRKRVDREEQPSASAQQVEGTPAETAIEPASAAPAAAAPAATAPAATAPAATAPEARPPRATPREAPSALRLALEDAPPAARVGREPSSSRPAAGTDATIGLSGIRLTRDEAFSLLRDAVTALASGDDAVPSERVRQKAFALLGRDSESLSERNFARILRDAHDAEMVDVRKRGDAFEVAAVTSVASVSDQLNEKEAALKAVADQAKAASAPPVQRGMGHRSAPARGGRGGFAAKAAAPSADFLLVGVVDDSPSADEEKPKRVRKPRAKKAASDE